MGRLKSKEAIGLRVGKSVGRYKVGKHLRVDIADNHFSYERDLESIAAAAALDGFYVIRSGVGADKLGSTELVRSYSYWPGWNAPQDNEVARAPSPPRASPAGLRGRTCRKPWTRNVRLVSGAAGLPPSSSWASQSLGSRSPSIPCVVPKLHPKSVAAPPDRLRSAAVHPPLRSSRVPSGSSSTSRSHHRDGRAVPPGGPRLHPDTRLSRQPRTWPCEDARAYTRTSTPL